MTAHGPTRRGNAPLLLGTAVVLLTMAGCAQQPAPMAYDPPGFFSALWHGLIAPLSLIGSIFLDIRVYAFPNSGWFYDLGFLLGLGVWAGGAGASR